jgi:hypothetical protein
MSASTGAITARGVGRGGSVRWAMLVLVVTAALAGGVLLGRAMAPSPPQTVPATQSFVPSTGVETLPSDAVEQASLKSQFGKSLANAGPGRAAVTIPAPRVETPRTVHWHQLAP